MLFKDFLSQNNNKPVEVVDPSNLNQCFDLVVKWSDSLGIPRVFPFQYAYQIYSNFGTLQSQYFTRIFNGPYDLVKEGDIVVWSWYYNKAGGHTGIATGKGDLYTFECFEQNDPSGTFSHLKMYNYDYVLGWLRPKNYPPAVQLTCDQKISKITDLVKSTQSDSDVRYQIKQILGV